MAIEITILISAISVSFAVYFGLKTNKRNDIKDVTEKATRDAKINFMLDEISRDVKAIKEEVKDLSKIVQEHTSQLVKLEASLKAEHKRLDGIERRLNMTYADREGVTTNENEQ